MLHGHRRPHRVLTGCLRSQAVVFATAERKPSGLKAGPVQACLLYKGEECGASIDPIVVGQVLVVTDNLRPKPGF